MAIFIEQFVLSHSVPDTRVHRREALNLILYCRFTKLQEEQQVQLIRSSILGDMRFKLTHKRFVIHQITIKLCYYWSGQEAFTNIGIIYVTSARVWVSTLLKCSMMVSYFGSIFKTLTVVSVEIITVATRINVTLISRQ